MNYAVLDIEATGGKAGTEKIIDIYIYRFDGLEVLDQFGSMVNPQRSIDRYVQKLTGITEKMVRGAPKFYELAKRVIEITEDCILVGHGVDFDYRMLRQEFSELGYDFERKTLDTLDLSKKLIPEAESHSLGKLTKSLGIPVNFRHTAEGDTRITLELFKILLEKDVNKEIIQSYAVHEPKSKIQINKLLHLEEGLPATTGIFYFLNENNQVIYLSAARNILQDVNEIFISTGKDEKRIQSLTSKVEFEKTGSMLIALLKENEERKIHKKFFTNKVKYMSYGIFADMGSEEFKVEKTHLHKKQPLLFFNHKRKAFKTINNLHKKLNLDDSQEFKKKIKLIKNDLKFSSPNLILIDKGRNQKEKSFIEINNGKPAGYGYYSFYNQIENEDIRRTLQTELSPDLRSKTLIKTYLQFHHFQKIIQFDENQPVKIK